MAVPEEVVQAVGASQYTLHGPTGFAQAVGPEISLPKGPSRGSDESGHMARANSTLWAGRGRAWSNERTRYGVRTYVQSIRQRTIGPTMRIYSYILLRALSFGVALRARLTDCERMGERHLTLRSLRRAYGDVGIVRFVVDSLAHFRLLHSFDGGRSNGRDSGLRGRPLPFVCSLPRTLGRRSHGRTPRKEVVQHILRLFVRQYPGRTLRLDRASERYAKVTANEFARHAECGSDLLRTAVLARTNRDDCGRFLWGFDFVSGHFPSLRPFGDHALSVARERSMGWAVRPIFMVRSAYLCKAYERTFDERMFVRDSAYRSLCHTMMERTYKHVFAPPDHPPEGGMRAGVACCKSAAG